MFFLSLDSYISVKSNKIHVKEKQSLTLTCESKGNIHILIHRISHWLKWNIYIFLGGAPQPTLTWWQNSKLKDASYER